jgi:hypothetical protein
MSDSYRYLTTEDLQIIYDEHRRNLARLEQKRARFGSLHLPTHITNEIEDTIRSLNSIETELFSRKKPKTEELKEKVDLPVTTTNNKVDEIDPFASIPIDFVHPTCPACYQDGQILGYEGSDGDEALWFECNACRYIRMLE